MKRLIVAAVAALFALPGCSDRLPTSVPAGGSGSGTIFYNAYNPISGRIVHYSCDASGANHTPLAEGIVYSRPARNLIVFAGPGSEAGSLPSDYTSCLISNLQGTSERSITTGGEQTTPVLSPTGLRAAYTNADGRVVVVNTDGSDFQAVADNAGRESLPVFSPDGMKLAYIGSDHMLYVVTFAANSNSAQDRTAIATNALKAKNGDAQFTWSPDGSRIAYAGFVNDGGITVSTSSDIYIVNIDGTEMKNLTNDTLVNMLPAFSPDGTRIAFARMTSGDSLQPLSLSDIWMMNADGTNAKNLTNSPDRTKEEAFPSWSPDGTTVMYIAYRSDERFGTLSAVDVASLVTRTLGSDVAYHTAFWAP